MAISTEEIIRQLEWEESASEHAAESALKAMQKATGGSQLSMSVGVDWLASNLETIAEKIGEIIANDKGRNGKDGCAKSLLSCLNAPDIAMACLSHAARACIAEKPKTYASMCCDVGVELAAMSAIKQAKSDYGDLVEKVGEKKSPAATAKWIADRGIEIQLSDRADAKRAGVIVCDALVSMGIIELEKERKSNVVVAGSIAGVIENGLANAIAMSHEAWPTLIKPNDWKMNGGRVEGGFYGAARVNRSHMIRTTKKVRDMVDSTWSSMSHVVEAVNILQGVEWAIDRRVFDVMQAMPEALTDSEKLMVGAAEKMLEHEKHYHVWTADYRYRLYSEAGLINPQGGDVQKALLRAHKGEVIGTDSEVVRFFKIGVAGKYGVDNVSIPDRLKWVEENHDNIVSAANNPFGGAFDFWRGAEKPWQFLQVCFEYAGWADDPEGFVATVVATPLDGKCSGIQHFSAMGRDLLGAQSTCLAKNEKGAAPADIYNDVRDVVAKKVEAVAAKGGRRRHEFLKTDEELLAEKWLVVGIDRGDVKRSVMTMPYSATERACFEQVLEAMRKKGKLAECQYEAAKFMQPILWASIPEVVGYARKAMEWLKASARAIIDHKRDEGCPVITFKNPNGAVVYQACWKNKRSTVRGESVSVSVNYADWGNIDKAKHALGISPNFIHSCDAAHMHNVIRKMGKGVHLHVIHDSFGVLPSRTPELYRVVREEFVKQYKAFGLHVLREQYPFLAPPPRRGKFDINEVLEAEFAFL